MRLSRQLSSRINQSLILRINELYHDAENRLYDQRHPEMLGCEKTHWEALAERYLSSSHPLACVDYGTGTGVVPALIGPRLKKTDALICVDLSEEMLKVCERKIRALDLACELRFLKSDGQSIPLPDGSADVITINAVLHHIYDLQGFAREAERILHPDGYLIVLHEPNADLKLPLGWEWTRRCAAFTANPGMVVYALVERWPLLERVLRGILSRTSELYRRRNEMLDEIASELLREKSIDFPLRGVEIQQLVDIHTEKRLRKEELLRLFDSCAVVEWTTYGYFDGANFLTRWMDGALQRRFPDKANAIRMVLRKKGRRDEGTKR